MTPRTIETTAHRIIGALIEITSAAVFFGAVAFFWILTP